MSTKAYYPISEIGKGKPGFAKTRSIIEAAFYGNNVVKINSLKEAYELAKNSPGTIVTDMPVYNPEAIGLDKGAKVLLFNDGSITGRYAAARRIQGEPGVNNDRLDKILMDAVYDTRWKKLYHAEAYIGLDKEFMVKAHLLIPQGEENILYNWMLNFQYINDTYLKMYKETEEDYKNPYFSPLLANDFSNLPDTLIITAEYDPLRDEGEKYARCLKKAGNRVEAYRMKDALHGYFALSTKYVLVRETYELINRFLGEDE